MRTFEYLIAELRRWPNVKFKQVGRGRHQSVVISHGDEQRSIFYSGSPVERRAVLNNITMARRVLRSIGARRDDE
jgi:hypothetical protein